MNDEFLLRFRRTPRPEFADALYKRISQKPQPRFVIPLPKKLTLRTVGASFVLMLLVAACASYIFYERPYRQVGGIWLTVEKTQKLEIFPMSMISTEEPSEQPSLYKCLSTEEAREILDFEFVVPTWAPKGFASDGIMCGVNSTSDFVTWHWTGADSASTIHILIRNLKWHDGLATRIGPPAAMFPVAPGSYSEVQVNGQPAVLIRGDWESPYVYIESPELEEKIETEVKWNKELGHQLYWVEGEVLYYLYTRSDVSVEDLIKMAESAR